jgi:hypothetical protein
VRQRVVLDLGTSPGGSLPAVDDVTDLVYRICGRISFEGVPTARAIEA